MSAAQQPVLIRPETYRQITNIAHWRASHLRGSIVESGDLENEAIAAILRGRKSIDGPMQDFQRRQAIVGLYQPRYGVCAERARLSKDLAVPSHESRVIAHIVIERLRKAVTVIEDRIIDAFLDGSNEAEMTAKLKIPGTAYRQRRVQTMKHLRKLVGK